MPNHVSDGELITAQRSHLPLQLPWLEAPVGAMFLYQVGGAVVPQGFYEHEDPKLSKARRAVFPQGLNEHEEPKLAKADQSLVPPLHVAAFYPPVP